MRTKGYLRGAVSISYVLLMGAVGLVTSLSFVVVGHKMGDIANLQGVIMPGVHDHDDVSARTPEGIEFTGDNGVAEFDLSKIGGQDDNRLGDNLGVEFSGAPPPPPFDPFVALGDLTSQVQGLIDTSQVPRRWGRNLQRRFRRAENFINQGRWNRARNQLRGHEIRCSAG